MLKLYKIIRSEKFIGFKRSLRRIILSPKNLTLCCLSLVSLIKITWLSFDPLVFLEASSRLIDRLLFETIYPLYFCMYSSVLLVLIGLYQGMHYKKHILIRSVKKLLIFLMIAGFPLAWGLSVAKGLRVSEQWVFTVGYILVVAADLVDVIGFIVIVILLCCSISRPGYNQTDTNLNRNNRMETNFKDTFNAKVDSDEEEERGILVMTNKDKSLLRKIVVLSAVSSSLGTIAVILFLAFTSPSMNESSDIIVGLYFWFFIEFVGCSFVFAFFTTEIDAQQRKVFRDITKIVLKRKQYYSRVYIKDLGLKHISKRLENCFIN